MASQFPSSSVGLHLSQVSTVLDEKEVLREVTDDYQTRHATQTPETCNFPTMGVSDRGRGKSYLTVQLSNSEVGCVIPHCPVRV